MAWRVRFDLEYDGTDFSGWQIQPGAVTVQGALEAALRTLYGKAIRVHGAGRTDAGVHALGQVAHAVLPGRKFTALRLCGSLNALTPASLAVHAVTEVDAAFDARRSAVSRHYRYRLSTQRVACDRQYVWSIPGGLSYPLLTRCAEALPGTHHFSSFCVAKSAGRGTLCRMDEARWRKRGREWHFDIRGNRFVHGMVRSLVGAMVEVAAGRMTVSEFVTLLERPGKGRCAACAPAHGLTLVHVAYDEEG